jgi:hypothetical protein
VSRQRRPDDTVRKDKDGTYLLRVGPFEGRTADRDHVAFSLARASGMDRSDAERIVRTLDSATPAGERSELSFRNPKGGK